MSEHTRARRANNLDTFKTLRSKLMEDFGLVEHTEYHYSLMIKTPCQYWPSANKWQYAGKTYHGTAQDFYNWLKRRLSA
jgi:hypothetical protein